MVIDLQAMFMILSDEASNHFCRLPPPSFNLSSILEKMKVASHLSHFAIEKNKLIGDIISSNPHKKTYGKIRWGRGCQIILED